MTWETERGKAGRRPFHLVEINLDYCALTYGVAPCQAILGKTGDHKCFNTRASCQDLENYDPAAKTYRFCDAVSGMPRQIDAIPSVVSIESAPTVIDPGRSLGKRASVRIEFRDHPHHDRGIDKYVGERGTGAAAADGAGYDPYVQGTFFGKLRARNPYYVGRALRVYSGFLPWDHGRDDAAQPGRTLAELKANARSQAYIMDRWQGPDSAGRFIVTAKDVLKLADDEKSQCPVQNTGRLSVGIAAGDGSCTLTPAGIGNAEYAASGTVLIGEELIQFTRAGDVLTFTVRPSDGTAAVAHNADDQVQQAQRWTSTRIDTVLKELLENFAGVPAAYIPFTDWQSEAAVWLSTHLLSVVIASPVGVATLVNELCEQALVCLWWDEIAQEIKFRAVRPQKSTAAITGDNAIIEDGFSRGDEPDQRISRCTVYLGRLTPIARLDDPTSFAQVVSAVDTASESSDEYGEQRARLIYSRWLGTSDRALAVMLVNRMLARYARDPVVYAFKLGAKDADLWTGDVFTLQHRLAQGFRGEQESVRVQTLEVYEDTDGRFAYKAMRDLFSGRYGFIGPDGLLGYTLASDSELAAYAWISDNSGVLGADDAYKII